MTPMLSSLLRILEKVVTLIVLAAGCALVIATMILWLLVGEVLWNLDMTGECEAVYDLPDLLPSTERWHYHAE